MPSSIRSLSFLDNGLILRLPGRALFQHPEKQIDIQRRPNALLERKLNDAGDIEIHIITSFPARIGYTRV